MEALLNKESIEEIRKDFPILSREIKGKKLVYLDNAATAQKPQKVIDSLLDFYQNWNSNVHRGIHYLSAESTNFFEDSRRKVQHFVNAQSEAEIIFTKGCTESINLVAASYASNILEEGDEILVSHMEHHSNLVPWHLIAEKTGAKVKAVNVTDSGELDLKDFDRKLGERTKIVALVHYSNTLGTINPVKKIIQKAHNQGAKVLIDGAQAVPHGPVDVQALDVDFYTFSGHKMYGPTGVGVLYAKLDLLQKMTPYQGGGEMIKEVFADHSTYNEPPFKFEAGTPNIADVIALKAAIEYMEDLGFDYIKSREKELLDYATQKLESIPGLRIIGTAPEKTAVVSFHFDGAHPSDIGMMLNEQGIAIRTGHHCTQPLMRHFNIPATSRASMAFYNTKEEIDKLYDGILLTKEILGI